MFNFTNPTISEIFLLAKITWYTVCCCSMCLFMSSSHVAVKHCSGAGHGSIWTEICPFVWSPPAAVLGTELLLLTKVCSSILWVSESDGGPKEGFIYWLWSGLLGYAQLQLHVHVCCIWPLQRQAQINAWSCLVTRVGMYVSVINASWRIITGCGNEKERTPGKSQISNAVLPSWCAISDELSISSSVVEMTPNSSSDMSCPSVCDSTMSSSESNFPKSLCSCWTLYLQYLRYAHNYL